MSIQTLSQLLQHAQQDIAQATDLGSLDQIRVQLLGKKGVLTEQLKQLGQLSPQERPQVGQAINDVKHTLQQALESRRLALQHAQLQQQLVTKQIDVTLPGRGQQSGGLHPVTKTLQRIQNLFLQVGFTVAEGPEIEDEYHNFEALNIPAWHPARAMHDTFYLENCPGNARYVLFRKSIIIADANFAGTNSLDGNSKTAVTSNYARTRVSA